MLDDLYQRGSGKIRMARAETGRAKEAVIVNTTGGLTDGDRFESSIHWKNKTRAIVTTQAAERIYQSRGDNAVISTSLVVDDGARAMWLPQETILFDRARLARETRVELNGNAGLIAVESCVFGRAAMGETVKSGHLRDSWQIRMDGDLTFADRFSLEGEIQAQLDQSAIANGATAIATIIRVGPNSAELQENIRQIIEINPAIGGCTSLDPTEDRQQSPRPAPHHVLTICRLFGKNAQELRTTIIAILEMLIVHDSPTICGSPLPRVWSM